MAHIGTWNKWYHYIRLEGLLLLSKKCRDVIESHKSTIFSRKYQEICSNTRWLFQLSFVTKRISEYKITMAILIYTRWNLSFIILWVSCGKKSGKKSDCNSSRDILFHFTSFYKYQLCKKHKNILFSINVQLCKNAANVLSFFFIERDNVIETICSSCFLFLCVFHTINFAHFLW